MAIVKYDDNSKDRKKPFGVKWKVDGKRKFRFFAKKSERDRFHKDLTNQEKDLGRSILDISPEAATAMKQCLDILGDPHDVVVACREYAEKINVIHIELKKAIDEYLHEKKLLGRDENYHRAIRNILERASVILPKDLAEWNNKNCHAWALKLTKEFAPVTVKNHVKGCNAFCLWAVRKKYLKNNPFKDAPIPDVIDKEIEFLSVDDVKRLFKAAVKYYPQAVPYMALNTFAGLRSSVCARLDIEAIDFKQKGIVIKAKIAKNNRRVYLDGHEPNLWAWLEWARQNAPEGFTLTKRQWDKVRSKVAEKTGNRKKRLAPVKMPHNAFRHSFCTYHVALYGDAGKTATLLTHRGNVSILYAHYKGNISNAQAKEYFNILPGESC